MDWDQLTRDLDWQAFSFPAVPRHSDQAIPESTVTPADVEPAAVDECFAQAANDIGLIVEDE